MTEHRWAKFWWQDWQRDPALRMCSPGARGVWMDMLCVMSDANPYGHLLVNNEPPTERQLASVFGCTEKKASLYLKELEIAGVFSRTEKGIIFSRRMVRDRAKLERAEKYGKKGGNPQLRLGHAPRVNPRVNPGVNPGVNGGGYADLHQEAESEFKKQNHNQESDRGGRERAKNNNKVSAKSAPQQMPLADDPPEAWRPYATTWETLAGVPHPARGAAYLDVMAGLLADVAQLDRGTYRDWRPLLAWLDDGIESQQILGAIGSLAERPGYRFPGNLAYFDKPVRSWKAAQT